ncbi:MAG: 23S rRNA (adenine(2030)-N(6))-methyltransferase RlmJ [Chromatiaceae bacterium]
MRPDDRLVLFELHPGEIGPLEVLFQADRRAQVARTDGLEGCVGRLPPKERQGLVLMDPSYEVRTDYTRIVDTLLRAHRRFATGSFALWYPKVDRWRTDTMERIIRASGLPKVQIVELGIGGSDEGMRTSGLVLVNPPWTLAASMQTVLPWLAQALAADENRSPTRCGQSGGRPWLAPSRNPWRHSSWPARKDRRRAGLGIPPARPGCRPSYRPKWGCCRCGLSRR